MDRKRKKLLALVVAIILIAVFSGSTLAYYSVTGRATNVVTSGSIRLQVIEKEAEGNPFPREGVKVIPGDKVTKHVTIRNVCEHPFWLRVQLVKGSSQEVLSANDVLQIQDLNRSDWTEHTDGYWYYNKILNPQETTSALFSQVLIDGDLVDQHDIGTALTITVRAEAVQSEHNPAGNPWEASGWPAA